MESPTLDALRLRIQRTHGWVLQAVVDLSPEQLSYRFGPTAPPLAWHIWHLARWADRFQASFGLRGDGNSNEPANPNRDLWHIEGMAEQWQLEPHKLGILETGADMPHDDAAALALQIDNIALLEYIQRTYAASEKALANLSDPDLHTARSSIMEYRIEGDKIYEAPGAPTTHLADILFHLSHNSRHLGMLEGLRGLLNINGTITV